MTYISGDMTQVTGYMTMGEMTFRQLDWLPLPLVSRTDFSFQQQCNIKLKSNTNLEKFKLGDY